MFAKCRNQTILNDVWEISGKERLEPNRKLLMLPPPGATISALRKRCSSAASGFLSRGLGSGVN